MTVKEMISFCFHKWAPWSGVIESYSGSLHQVRKCEKCGKIKSRIAISIFRGLDAPKVNGAIAKVSEEKHLP